MQCISAFLDIAKSVDFRWKKKLIAAELKGCVMWSIYFLEKRWLHLSTTHEGIPLRCNLFRRRIDQKKLPVIATNNWIVLAVWWSVKYSFAPNSSTFRKNCLEGKNCNFKALCFTSKRKKIAKLFVKKFKIPKTREICFKLSYFTWLPFLFFVFFSRAWMYYKDLYKLPCKGKLDLPHLWLNQLLHIGA